MVNLSKAEAEQNAKEKRKEKVEEKGQNDKTPTKSQEKAASMFFYYIISQIRICIHFSLIFPILLIFFV